MFLHIPAFKLSYLLEIASKTARFPRRTLPSLAVFPCSNRHHRLAAMLSESGIARVSSSRKPEEPAADVPIDQEPGSKTGAIPLSHAISGKFLLQLIVIQAFLSAFSFAIDGNSSMFNHF